MPLFTYICPNCKKSVERFTAKSEPPQIICECGAECERQISAFNNRPQLDSRDTLTEKILPQANKISEQIAQGNDAAFLDICGEK